MTSPTSPPASGPGADWPAQVAQRIDSAVGRVRDKTTVPALTAARVVVYGVLAAALGATLLVLLVIGVIRLADVYIPLHPIGRRVWIIDAGASAIFLALGMLLWRKRRPRQV
jgi:hypothetical protein